MNTPHGWARARIRLKGLEPEYNSLREAYYIAAMQKQDKIEAKQTIAKVISSIENADVDKVKESLGDYFEEIFPSIKENREDFIKSAKKILEKEAGREIDLSEYKKANE